MKRKLLATLLATLPLVASATPITIGFGGTVDNDPYGTGLTDFTGQFTYDTDWADLDPTANTGNYQGSGAAYGISVAFAGGGSYDLYGQFFMLALLDGWFGIGDQYIAYGTDGGALFMQLELTDSSASILSNDLLPTDAPLLSGFDWPRFALFDADAELAGMVTSLSCLDGCLPDGGGDPGNGDPGNGSDPGNGGGSPGNGGDGGNPIPEPTSLALLGLGLVALARSRRS